MTTFNKQILKPGKYLARDLTGKRVEFNVTPERIDHWIESFNKMKASGLKIPAPWKHDPNANPTKDPSSKDNAGFWQSLWKTPDGSLHGQVDVPLKDDAEKIGTTVQEVSPLVRPKWKDGVGTDWPDSINHIALVQTPVIPGQENFQPLESVTEQDKLAVAASLSDFTVALLNVAEEDKNLSVKTDTTDSSSSKATTPTIQMVLESLNDVGLTLPDDTTFDNLAERIVVAGSAISGTQIEDEEEEVKEQPNPVAMAAQLLENDKEITSLKDSLKSAKNKTDHLTALSTATCRNGLEVKLSDLHKSGKLSKKYFDEKVRPLLDGYELSLDETGNAIPGKLEQLIEVLEQAPAVDPDTSFFASGEILGSLTEESREKVFDPNDEKAVQDVATELIKAGGLVTY